MIIPIYELFLSAERIISSINPEKYYRRTLSWKVLYPITLIVCTLMYSQIFIVHGAIFLIFLFTGYFRRISLTLHDYNFIAGLLHYFGIKSTRK